jgi:hypothetical protein
VHPGDDSHPDTPDGVCQPGNAPPSGHAGGADRAPAKPAARGRAKPSASPPDAAIAGLEAAVARTGEDARRRGWYWHWNHLVTQYAPLLGLKGVGLLNSYTVWTDRREESPLRGYAFPSQQSEAAFYGEDRAELITINKILVALDLIEIRKEMVTRADEQGRRWRVPHNLYRVKDHGDGFSLTAKDVLRVVELADRDKAVYRQIRNVFSSRFAPIDADNVWWGILDELREHPTWQRLAEQVAAEEARASARTRAGHAARKSAFLLPSDGDGEAPGNLANDSATDGTGEGGATSVASINTGSEVDVAPANSGSATSVAPANRGSGRKAPSMVDPANTGRPTIVEQTNTTKYQYVTTTTTTETSGESGGIPSTTPTAPTVTGVVEPSPNAVARPAVGNGPGGAAAPVDAPGESAGIGAFEEANGRPSSPAERNLLRGIAAQVDDAARASGVLGGTGWGWVAAATYEAVEAGSAFVAPRRLREIALRWVREGAPGERRPDPAHAAPSPRVASAPTPRESTREADATRADSSQSTRPIRIDADDVPAGRGPEPSAFAIPECGMTSAQVWASALAELAASGTVPREQVDAWLRPARLLARRGDGALIVGAPNALAQTRLAARCGPALAATFARILGGPVGVEVVVISSWLAARAADDDDGEADAAQPAG